MNHQTVNKMKGNCIVCGTEIEVEICCSGRECGCMGQPIEPPVCDSSCYDELMNNLDNYYPNKPKDDLTPFTQNETKINKTH